MLLVSFLNGNVRLNQMKENAAVPALNHRPKLLTLTLRLAMLARPLINLTQTWLS